LSSSIERLIVDMKESLERQIQSLEHRIDVGFSEIRARFDTQALRLDQQGADPDWQPLDRE
jgi:hypothetical protein